GGEGAAGGVDGAARWGRVGDGQLGGGDDGPLDVLRRRRGPHGVERQEGVVGVGHALRLPDPPTWKAHLTRSRGRPFPGTAKRPRKLSRRADDLSGKRHARQPGRVRPTESGAKPQGQGWEENPEGPRAHAARDP